MKPRHLPLRLFDRHAVWLEAATNEERTLANEYRCALYRFFDFEGELLYAGISKDLPTRWDWHRCRTAWYSQAQYLAVSFYPERAEAERAEAACIRREQPQFNKSRPKSRPGWRAEDDVLFAPPPAQFAD